MSKLLPMIDNIEVIDKWFNNKTGDNLAKVFELEEAQKCVGSGVDLLT